MIKVIMEKLRRWSRNEICRDNIETMKTRFSAVKEPIIHHQGRFIKASLYYI